MVSVTIAVGSRRPAGMFALGFTVREDDVAVVIDLRVLRNLRIRLWRVAGYPDTPYYCPPGHGLLYAQADIPPISILEIREFHADRGVILYVNPLPLVPGLLRGCQAA